MPIIQTHTPSVRRDEGFALVVIAALFIAFAVIAAAAVERNTTTQLITRRDAAREQLTRLSNAIIEYAVFNQTGGVLLYPCPARFDLATTATAFGKSVENGSAVQDCATVDYTTGVSLLNSNVYRGMVPVQTLSEYGLGVNDAFDPWNNRIMYVVNRGLTKGAATTSGTLSTVQSNNPTIGHGIITTSYAPPDFILISYGRDGVGGIRRESTAVSIGCTNSTTKPRFENCDTDIAFMTTPTYTAATAGDSTYADDLLSFGRQ